uniref:Uncharacterized protein n=1 Tax=Anguilla anguilla TaxID=7936 RepID=A0A0E9WR63_ANGAN
MPSDNNSSAEDVVRPGSKYTCSGSKSKEELDHREPDLCYSSEMGTCKHSLSNTLTGTVKKAK